MGNRTRALILTLGLITLSVAVYAGDVKPFGAGQTRTITLTAPTVVGETTLQPGEYKVQHFMEADQHVLIFKGKKAEARVNCKMVNVEPSKLNLQLFKAGSNGERILTTLIFRGDNYQHVIAE